VAIKYTINEDQTLTLTDLDKITDAGLTKDSEPSKSPVAYGAPKFEDESVLAGVPESDLTLLAMTLILAKADKETENTNGTLDTYLETWQQKSLNTGKGLDKDEVLIVAIINTMVDQGDDMTDLTKMLEDLLGVKN
jgi:hypothetical protein